MARIPDAGFGMSQSRPQSGGRALPSGAAFGARPTPQPTSPIPDIVSSGAGVVRGLNQYADDLKANGGKGLAALAEGLGQAGESFAKSEAAQDRMTMATAQANYTRELIRAEAEFANDQDYATMKERFAARAETARSTILQTLPGHLQGLFATGSGIDMDRAMARVGKQAWAQERDAGRAWVTAFMGEQRQTYLQTSDPELRAGITAATNGALSGAAGRGFLSETERVTLGRQFIQDVTADKFAMLAPRDQVRVLSQGMTKDATGFPVFGRTNTDLDFLPVDRRAAMLRQAEAHVQAEDRQRLHELSDEVRDAAFVLDRGRVPDNLAALQAKVRGTKYELPLTEAVQDQGTVAAFIRKPLAEQRGEIARLAGTETTDRRQLELQQRFQRAHAHILTEVKEGRGLTAAAEIGIITRLDTANPQDAESLRARAAQARAASEHFGAPVSPLLPSEVKQLEAALDQAAADDAVRIVAGLHSGLGAGAASIVSASWAKDRPEFGVALSLVGDKPMLARELLQGGKLARENKDVLPGKADRVSTVGAVASDLFTPDTADALDSYISAADAVYAARRVHTGDLTFDSRVYEQALRDVMGNPVAFNGRTILPPVPGMEASAVRDTVRRLTYADLSAFGNGQPAFRDGKPFNPELFKRSTFGAEAQLVTAGAGKYLVMVPGLGYIASDRGGAYVLDLRAAIEARR